MRNPHDGHVSHVALTFLYLYSLATMMKKKMLITERMTSTT